MRKLQDVGRDCSSWSLPIGEASFPAPFSTEPEFNAPVHGTWNIVHMGMQVPEAHQIYVCAINCMRGVVLTAAEMNASDRFSCVLLEEKDLLHGTVEEITIQGVIDVIRRLPKHPPMVLLYTVCLHHFLGSDLDYIYRSLAQAFPDIFFARCYMDPIMRKSGLTPEQKTRKGMFDALQPLPAKAGTVTLLGSDLPLDSNCDLITMLEKNGGCLRQIQDCKTYEDYLTLAEGEVFVSTYPTGKYGAEETAKRLGRPHLYLPACFGYDEISGHLNALSDAMGIPPFDTTEQITACEAALSRARDAIGDTPVSIDYTFHPRPLGLARLLLEHGFNVETVYLDAISFEERSDFLWLQEHTPELRLTATARVELRVQPRNRPGLALGQKAAWFTGTTHFVNLVQGGGLYGFDGICQLAHLMEQAMLEEKDTEDLVIRKGLGCESCI
ncbi:MAG: nitrogenase component 1 [Oscillospiraceae bacterium]|nr:nitrogenase component 1 [Oscillospiraceae bacterium]